MSVNRLEFDVAAANNAIRQAVREIRPWAFAATLRRHWSSLRPWHRLALEPRLFLGALNDGSWFVRRIPQHWQYHPQTGFSSQLGNKISYLRGRDKFRRVIEDDALDLVANVSPIEDVGDVGKRHHDEATYIPR